ncbi:hypothetical protein [Novosphingobium guangzhouense]|uniref:Uncharacterized protein n=1 Tax=Novosphingobium guangzhouense TaxID=1850347 RepID=A0A2K2G5A0_9SPHN|nr:hypothetical protein [Novosphingobium guangzhouense]PNU06216.1 hypothetical protein A8V01_12770 [Novosphingobium guangzhouense]
MIDQAALPADLQGAEAAIRRDLARSGAAAASTLPVLRYLVAAEPDNSFAEEVLARVKGILRDVAAQVLDALIGSIDRRAHAHEEVAVLSRAFLDDTIVLAHAHAVALEWQLTERLSTHLGLDPVVSPFVRARVAAGDALMREFLTAQARWVDRQRRMALPLVEVPAPVLDAVLAIVRALVEAEPALSNRVAAVEAEVRLRHDEISNRLMVAERVVADDAFEATAPVSACGVTLFLTAFAARSGQPRDGLVAAMQPGQQTRLALLLLAAGTPAALVDAQIREIHGRTGMPAVLAGIDAMRAAAILAQPGRAK